MIDLRAAADADTHTDKVCILTSCRTESEAIFLIGTLAECNIKAQMEGALTSNFRAEVPGFVRILVRADDLETAQQILGEFNAERSRQSSRYDDEGEEEGAMARRRRNGILIGAWIMLGIVVYFAVNSLDMF